MAIFKTLVKSMMGSPAHLARYRQSFKLRDALIELRSHNYSSILADHSVYEDHASITDICNTTDLTQCLILRKPPFLVSHRVYLTAYIYSIFRE